MLATEDMALARRLLKGDEQAFSSFFADYFPRLMRFVTPRVRAAPDLAEEIVQVALMQAVRGMSTYRGEASMFTWLCGITRRELVRVLAREQRAHDHLTPLLDDADHIVSVVTDDADDPAQIHERGAGQRLVHQVMDSLPARYGDVLEWKYVEGLSVDEISQRLDAGATATQSLLARARSAFRDAYERAIGADANGSGTSASPLRTRRSHE